jgi:two-component system LytT family sensor kinase
LVRRPRRAISTSSAEENETELPIANRPGLSWAASFGVWTFVSLAATATIYQLYRRTSNGMRLGTIAGMEFSQILAYAPLTPFVFSFALRYPVQRRNWARRSLLHLAAGIVFTLAHISLRAMTPYGYWDPAHRQWSSAIWDSYTHAFRSPWHVLQSMFLANVVDDVTGTYIPIVLIAHAMSYYRRFRERELRATQLEGQLAKAHLQTLKSQLQPHFLFNTMHSISALMLTDVNAADRMMSRLSDLLRMSLESAGTQITTLNRELEFVNCYLDIEKVRFEERLHAIFDVAPETLDAQVPHLLLQPLVDNAVKHGISKVPGGGEIRITVTTQNGELQLKIEDNGPGFKGLSTVPMNGLGLRITRERLESLYGQNHSFEVVSPPNGGVTICVSIPLRIQPDAAAALQHAIV